MQCYAASLRWIFESPGINPCEMRIVVQKQRVHRLLHNVPQSLRKFFEERICTESSRLFS